MFDILRIKMLGKKLAHEEAHVRIEAICALGKFRCLQAIELLKRMLGDKDDFVRMAAAQALAGTQDSQAMEPLVKLLQDRNATVREVAAAVLGELKDPRAIDPLIVSLGDEYDGVRQAAAEGLKQMGDSHWMDVLLGHEEGFSIICGSKDLRAVKMLVRMLGNRTGQLSHMRVKAAETLGVLKDRQAGWPLINALLYDEDSQVRDAASDALAELQDHGAIQPLKEALVDENSHVRQCAAEGLKKLGQTQWGGIIRGDENDFFRLSESQDISIMITLLNKAYTPNQVRIAAARTLGEFKETQALGPLCHALDDINMGTRGAAAEALGELRDSGAIQPLIHILGDREVYVRKAAAEALNKLGEKQWSDIILGDKDDFARLGAAVDLRAAEPLIRAINNGVGDAKDALQVAAIMLFPYTEDTVWKRVIDYTYRKSLLEEFRRMNQAPAYDIIDWKKYEEEKRAARENFARNYKGGNGWDIR